MLTTSSFCSIITTVLKRGCQKIVGVDDAEGPPVPIPNTEVKLSGAENTWLATARENREMPTHKSVHPAGWAFFYFQETLKTVGQKKV